MGVVLATMNSWRTGCVAWSCVIVGCASPTPRAQTYVAPPPQAAADAAVSHDATRVARPPDSLEGFWTQAQIDARLAPVHTFSLEANLRGLTPAERRAIDHLVRAGESVSRLYEGMRHRDALRIRDLLARYETTDASEQRRLASLRRLYRYALGPIVSVPGRGRVAWAPVSPYEPGRNFYPHETTADAFNAYVRAHPAEEASLRGSLSVVRLRTPDLFANTLATLDRFPVLDALHPGLREAVSGAPDPNGYVAVPYSVAYPQETLALRSALLAASAELRADDPELARTLSLRASDVLSDDYAAGDAYWVTSALERIDVQIGAYETYDDHLMGARGAYGMSIVVRAADDANSLAPVLAALPRIDGELPGGPYNPGARTAIPVGVYDVAADFGQARGLNTASILPNDADPVRRFGRRILIRRNVLRDPGVVLDTQRQFQAAVRASQQHDLSADGDYERTLFHEIGHYLGPRVTASGRSLIDAFGDTHNVLEEMKADLVSLFLVPRLVSLEYLHPVQARSFYAAGVWRTLLVDPPSPTGAYETMELMQQNYFLEHGALRFVAVEGGRLEIDYARFPTVVSQMLGEVFAIQRSGDAARARAFIAHNTQWRAELQGVLARRLATVAATDQDVVYPLLGEQRTEAEQGH